MSEKMGVRVEAWPFACDAAGIWLLDPSGSWVGSEVMQDSDPLFELDSLCFFRAPTIDEPILIHQTSSRAEGPHVFLTHAVIYPVQEGKSVLETWPHAEPITLELLELWEAAIPHASNEAPTVRDADVLVHALRHVRFLRDNDRPAYDDLPPLWHEALEPIKPALYRWFQRPAKAA